MYHSMLMPLQVGQQPLQRSGSQQLTVVDKGKAAVNAMHFINVHGTGHHFRAPIQEDLYSLQTQRFC